MVTLFGDRVPLTMLFAIVRKRQSAVLKSRHRFDARPFVSSAPHPEGGAIAAGPMARSEARPARVARSHEGPSLIGLRHVWYREAVEHDPRYDAHYFVRSGEWVEPKCADPQCALCKDRPERHPGPRRARALPALLKAREALAENARVSV
ncbi:MAG TPA: hypothetical protein VNM24_14370 [Burkholderiales bacterium]|jgi:hypothetical protein|nr:hypothetical protein [Burkholderiales bacterium]